MLGTTSRQNKKENTCSSIDKTVLKIKARRGIAIYLKHSSSLEEIWVAFLSMMGKSGYGEKHKEVIPFDVGRG